MQLSPQQKFILFALGRCYEECNKRFRDAPLHVNMSKVRFIELARAAGMVHKGERALYRNLEGLQHKKLVSYNNRSLKLTERGQRHFQHLHQQMDPYVTVSLLLKSEDILKYSKVQARFK